MSDDDVRKLVVSIREAEKEWEEDGSHAGWYGYFTPEMALGAAEALENVAEWATTEPTPDPSVTNPAMIGHFAGFQKAREAVRGILGIDEDEFLDSLEGRPE